MSQKIKSLIYLCCFIASAVLYEVITSEDAQLTQETAELANADTQKSSPEAQRLEDIQ